MKKLAWGLDSERGLLIGGLVGGGEEGEEAKGDWAGLSEEGKGDWAGSWEGGKLIGKLAGREGEINLGSKGRDLGKEGAGFSSGWK